MLAAAMLGTADSFVALPRWFDRVALTMTSPHVRQALWSAGRRLVANEDLGFAFAERVPLEALGSAWPLCEAAPSLRALLHSYMGWSGVLLDCVAQELREDETTVWIRHVPRAGVVIDRAEEDFRAAMAVKLWRKLHRDRRITPVAVRFTYPRPRSLRAHAAQLGTCTLRFSQPAFELGIERRWFDRELPGGDRRAFARLDALLRSCLRERRELPLETRVEALVAEGLARHASLPEVAASLRLSVRTLRRRLTARGQSFRAILDAARRREAQLLVELGELPLREVARLVGLSNDGALRHAARRWRRADTRTLTGRI
jgi:AraC-like DNA-binding protein